MYCRAVRTVPDHTDAPEFHVTYSLPAHKAATDAPCDQANQLRKRCAPGGCGACTARAVPRSAGRYTAWTAEEAIRAARLDNRIPTGAEDVKAAIADDENTPPACN